MFELLVTPEAVVVFVLLLPVVLRGVVEGVVVLVGGVYVSAGGVYVGLGV